MSSNSPSETMNEPQQHADLREEARRILAAAEERSVPVRLMGGVAVFIRCPAARQAPLDRDYKDIDLVATGSACKELEALLIDLGYAGDQEFNALNGRSRMLFFDPMGRQIDVILDRLEMCHTLDLRRRLLNDPDTLTPDDLLLSKLQVVEINERDLKDASALLHDHELDGDRIPELLSSDWGWWRTVTANLDHVVSWSSRQADYEEQAEQIRKRSDELRQRIEDAPKGMRWRARAKMGDKMRWYELPEEVDQ